MARLPEYLRSRLAAEAKANGRSMNAEIIARLEQSFRAEHDMPSYLDAFERWADEWATHQAIMSLIRRPVGKVK